MTHFQNALLCKNHYHGTQRATCTIETLAELYYFGIYPYDREFNERKGNELFAKLIKLCQLRNKYGPTCKTMDGLWDFLTRYIRGFSPRGTSSAVIFTSL